jgi:hypothetical protein
MPNLTFLGIENPLGVLGVKVKGTLANKESLNRLNKIEETRTASQHAVVHATNRYENRAGSFPANIMDLMVVDTVGNRDYALELLKTRGENPNLRLALCSSLNSMLKYLDNYRVANPPDLFDTVIVYGHGLPGSINMGMGKLGIDESKKPGEDLYEETKRKREDFGLQQKNPSHPPVVRRIRALNMVNTDIWTAAFAGIAASVAANEETDYFHLFLMGCSVGQKTEEKMRLQKSALAPLKAALGGQLEVCISAPIDPIDDNHLNYLLLQLRQGTIRQDCVNGGFVPLEETNPVPQQGRKAKIQEREVKKTVGLSSAKTG